jgi:uncharacterized membrane protein YkoI
VNSKLIASGFASAGVLCLASIGTGVAQTPQAQEAISTEQAIECLRTATAATPGRVEGMEVDHERGQLVCEVEIIAENGAKSEIHVDIATGKVIRGAR